MSGGKNSPTRTISSQSPQRRSATPWTSSALTEASSTISVGRSPVPARSRLRRWQKRRRALNDGRTAREQIELVLTQLDAAGIQAPPAVKPLPSVTLGEVRLVAWMAVKGHGA